MLLAFDTFYTENSAKTICIAFENWADETPKTIYTDITSSPEAYESGAFYKRELPCILHLLQKMNLDSIEIMIIDGFVVLDDNGKLGLGGHLFHHFEQKIPIIGVAKNDFAHLNTLKRALLRGESKKPLFITALGIDLSEATEHIRTMAGEFRMPTLLKQLDALTRSEV
jgi:deoxyribonuclease V